MFSKATTEASGWEPKAAEWRRIHNGKITTYSTKNGLSNDSIYERCLRTHRETSGLARGAAGSIAFETENSPSIQPATGCLPMSSGPFTGILKARSGSPRRRGSSRWTGDSFRTYTTKDGLANDETCSIYQDHEGTLWIGSCSGGLSRFKDGKFTAYTTRQGMFDDIVFQILEDDQGNLWMSCNRGVYRASKKESERVCGRERSSRFNAFPMASPTEWPAGNAMAAFSLPGGRPGTGDCGSPLSRELPWSTRPA